MAWFDRNRGDQPVEEAWARLNAVVEQSRLSDAVQLACGPHGLRRFIVRFELRAGRPRVTGLDTEPLSKGGGPPSQAAFAAHVGGIEAALGQIHRRFPAPFTWDRGALGVLRGADGVGLSFRFDEDADAYRLAEVPLPTGEAYPLETPGYVAALAAWERRIDPVRARWLTPGPEDSWTLDQNRLIVSGPAGNRVLGVDPLALYWPRGSRFEWLVEKPVGDELPFVEPVLTVEASGAMELAVFAAARMKRVGVFQAEIAGEKGEILFAALRE